MSVVFHDSLATVLSRVAEFTCDLIVCLTLPFLRSSVGRGKLTISWIKGSCCPDIVNSSAGAMFG